MQLHFQLFDEHFEADPSSPAPLVLVPGLFGSVANWRSVAKALSKTLPVYVIDQRNHGRSPHSEEQSYDSMVADLIEFCDDQELDKIHLAGHSMGGKVAMLTALEHDRRLASLTVLDIAPVTYTHSHAPFLEALLKVDLSKLESRAEADRALKTAIPDTPTRLFLLQSLTGSPGQYQWRLNLPVLHAYMDELVSFPQVAGSSAVPCLVIGGENSTYLQAQHHARLRQLFPNCEFATVTDAGHWLHAEQPAKVINIMEKFLRS